jgi:hypothetical protein
MKEKMHKSEENRTKKNKKPPTVALTDRPNIAPHAGGAELAVGKAGKAANRGAYTHASVNSPAQQRL